MISRRDALVGASAALFAPSLAWAASSRLNPRSIAVGDVGPRSAVLWARGRSAGRLWVQLSDNPGFQNPRELRGPAATAATDFTARLVVNDLPWNQRIWWRATVEGNDAPGEWMNGTFRTAGPNRDVRFAWGGDTGGQGFGINDDRGGMRIFDAIRQAAPDFLVHCGDLVYHDAPIRPVVDTPGFKGTWRNLVTPEVAKVSETLDEMRGRYRYNHIDDNFRTLLTEVPVLHTWDDHEVKNNWYPRMTLRDGRYRAGNVAALVPNARRAFREYTPLAPGPIYRKVPYGPLLDCFLLDTRSFRGPNSTGQQSWYGPSAEWLGAFQRDWLKRELRASTARWKAVFCSMPLGLMSRDAQGICENVANGPGAALGRELEVAEILSYSQQHGVRNVVWFTADLHYATATHYSPTRGAFKNFDPFWEFMAGPLNAGTGRIHKLDDTFGARTEWVSIAPDLARHAPPSEGHQFFGVVDIDTASQHLTVRFFSEAQTELTRLTLPPHRPR